MNLLARLGTPFVAVWMAIRSLGVLIGTAIGRFFARIGRTVWGWLPARVQRPLAWVGHQVGQFGKALSQGEYPTFRVILGIVIIWAIFAAKTKPQHMFWLKGLFHSTFLSAGNITTLMTQISPTAMISIGVVLVLLLGQIDLSVGAVSGFAAATAGVLSVNHGWSGPAAIVAGLVTGLAVGFIHGVVITRFHVPPFIATLAGYLGWQGAQLKVLGTTGSINITNTKFTNLDNYFFGDGVGWMIVIVVVVVFAAMALAKRLQRQRAGLVSAAWWVTYFRIAIITVVAVGAMVVFSRGRGLALGFVILLASAALFQFAIKRTKWGRQLFAVGGNEEAARRAGMPVLSIKMSVFMLASMMAAAGGILEASREFSVAQSAGGGQTLLNSIAAPVIAGTSLFGGRGSMWSAVLGAVVIGSISNGMDLLSLTSAAKFMITGAVLLLAVTIDSLAKSRRRGLGKV